MPLSVDININGKIVSRVEIRNVGNPDDPATDTERLYDFEHTLPNTPGAIKRRGTVRHDRNDGPDVLLALVMAEITKRTLIK